MDWLLTSRFHNATMWSLLHAVKLHLCWVGALGAGPYGYCWLITTNYAPLSLNTVIQGIPFFIPYILIGFVSFLLLLVLEKTTSTHRRDVRSTKDTSDVIPSSNPTTEGWKGLHICLVCILSEFLFTFYLISFYKFYAP